MGKYQPLHAYLVGRGELVTLSFDDVAALVGGLPVSARDFESWWGNDVRSHSQCRSWNAAGYSARPDLAQQEVTFTRRR